MMAWTAIGSLLHYFASIYGDHFFVYLNAAFYGLGLPLSYSQKKFDVYFDSMYGSKYTFRRRLWMSLTVLIVCLLLAPFLSEYGIIIMVGIVGICTWSSHGAVTTLSSLVKLNSSTMQQIGCAMPAFYAVIMSFTMDIDSNSSRQKLVVFYYATAFLISPGLVAWVRNLMK